MAKEECLKLEKAGYVAIDSYIDDYDMVVILEYSKGTDKWEVMARHAKYIQERVERDYKNMTSFTFASKYYN